MKVRVTQEHIRCGERRSPRGCPIALALREKRGLSNVRVHLTHAFTPSHEFRLPLEAQEFIKAFDNRSPVEPFSFELWL